MSDQHSPDSPEASTEPGIPPRLAVIVTPLTRVDVLAYACGTLGYDDVLAVPSGSGALATLELPAVTFDDWDIAELLGTGDDKTDDKPDTESDDADTADAETADEARAHALAKSLGAQIKPGVVLFIAELARDVGVESGVSGQLSAWAYQEDGAEEASAGLLLSNADSVLEAIVLGSTRPRDVDGAINSADAIEGRMPGWEGKKGSTPDEDESA